MLVQAWLKHDFDLQELEPNILTQFLPVCNEWLQFDQALQGSHGRIIFKDIVVKLDRFFLQLKDVCCNLAHIVQISHSNQPLKQIQQVSVRLEAYRKYTQYFAKVEEKDLLDWHIPAGI